MRCSTWEAIVSIMKEIISNLMEIKCGLGPAGREGSSIKTSPITRAHRLRNHLLSDTTFACVPSTLLTKGFSERQWITL